MSRALDTPRAGNLDPITIEVIGSALSSIVEQMDTTTVVLPGMTARVDAYLNLILELA